MILRDYQRRAIEMLYAWFDENETGNPVLSMPGGSGKSLVIAELVRGALEAWPDTRVLMLVHSKELIAQNAEKLRKLWPNAPLGIYSASLNKKNLGEPITYAGIQSIGKKAKELGHIDLIIIDEVHCVSHTESGTYRKLISDLTEINPGIRIVGLSASPYRLGSGMITEGNDALFSSIIEPIKINELIDKGHLCTLRSKSTSLKLDASKLHKLAGEFKLKEMELSYNTNNNNARVVSEIIEKADDRTHWLIFCSGIAHSEAIAQQLIDCGIPAASLSSNATSAERDEVLMRFETGQIRALCNVGILTTGYDFPALDCIVFLRSTMSPGLYLQMAVRGMRPFKGKENCLVLDFAGVVATHGPIVNITPPKQKGSGGGEAPVKMCDTCSELVHISAKVCPACGTLFPVPKETILNLSTTCIMGGPTVFDVTRWAWRSHMSKTTGKEMLAVTYFGCLSDTPVTEYLCVLHSGYAGEKSIKLLGDIAEKSGAKLGPAMDKLDRIAEMADVMNHSVCPSEINFIKEGKFFKVNKRVWK